jgi:hypothetical protein
MDYPVLIEGFERHDFVVRSSPWGSGSLLLMDGESAPPGPRRNQYILTRPDGTEVLVKFRNSLFDPVPQIIVDDKVFNVTRPLSWPITIWCFIPLLLCFTPGFDGIMLGFGGSWINTRMFRTEWSTTQKYLATAAVTLGSGVLYLVFSGRTQEVLDFASRWLGIGLG